MMRRPNHAGSRPLVRQPAGFILRNQLLHLDPCQSTLQGFFSVHGKLTPFVLVDRPFPQLRANFVGADDYAGGKIATEHLIQIGRRRLAYIGSPDLGPAADRFRGFRSALLDHGIELREKFIISSQVINDPADNLGYDMMQQLLRAKPRPTGVFCHNDIIAIGAMKATLDAGLSVPGDIAFVGFDNVRYSKYLHVPLTSIDQSTSRLGETAAQLALDLIARKIEKPKTILLAPTLVVRESTIGLKAAAKQPAVAGQSSPREPQARRRLSRR